MLRDLYMSLPIRLFSTPLVVGREVDRVLLELLHDRLGRVHAGVHRVVDALELGDVDHPGAVAEITIPGTESLRGIAQ